MKNKLALLGLGLASGVASAQESFTPPTAVTTTITSLENAATGYANIILPYIAAVGLAFIGISVVYLLFKVFRRFVGGK